MSSDLLKPTINIYVDICPDESMSRITKDRSLIELYENKEYLKEVREKYFEAFEKLKEQENISIIDGNRKPEIILDEIWSQVKSLLS